MHLLDTTLFFSKFTNQKRYLDTYNFWFIFHVLPRGSRRAAVLLALLLLHLLLPAHAGHALHHGQPSPLRLAQREPMVSPAHAYCVYIYISHQRRHIFNGRI